MNRLSLKDWAVLLLPAFVYVPGMALLKALLGSAGFAPETAGAVAAFLLLPGVLLWYLKGKPSGPEAPIRGGVLLSAVLLLLLALTAEGLARLGNLPPQTLGDLSLWEGLGILVLGPVNEELLYRGLVFGRCRTALGDRGAILLSSLLFGAAHTGLYGMAGAFLAGAVLCVVLRSCNRMGAAMLSHSLLNLASLLGAVHTLPDGFCLAGGLLLGCVMILSFYRLKGE